MSSLPANTSTPAARSISIGGMVQPTGAVGDERDAGLSHRLRGVGHFPLGDPAEAEAVADRHFAGETERLGAGTDLLDIEEAQLARLVQMNATPTPRRAAIAKIPSS